MNLRIDYLRTFVTLAEAGNFTRTGERVHLSQSAVSMQIKRLEEEVGKKLLDRGGRSVRLTPEGRTLIDYARRIVAEHDQAVRALTRPSLEGYIRFGSPEHYTAGILPRLLASFSADFPEVKVEMRCENSDVIRSAVERGELDVGLSTQISGGGRVIAHDPVVWVAPQGFVHQKHRTLPLAVFEEDCIFRAWALEALDRAGLKYRIVYVSRSISGLLDAVRAGLAVAPVIRSNTPDDLRILGPEEGLPVLPISNIVLHRSGKPPSEIIDCFTDHVVRSFRDRPDLSV